MELKERIALIIKENKFKQKELAAIVGVTESYISTLLSGRNQNVSNAVANLIEEKLGYNAQWVLHGTGPKRKHAGGSPELSDIHRKAIFRLEKLTEEQVKAVIVFMDSLEALSLE